MITHIVYDLSEVLIPGLIGIEKTLESLTGVSSDHMAKAMGSHPYYEPGNNLDQLLKGQIDFSRYSSDVLTHTGLTQDFANQFEQECLAMFEKPYAHTQALIEKTAKACHLLLLSDHCERWTNHIESQHDFLNLFSGILWSHEVGATKKTHHPFTALINRYQLTPDQCLFVDDNAVNISVAKQLGFQTVHFLGKQSVDDIYSALDGKNV